ncbi:2OG-Fe dioxygenase family protein [Amycolatopsis plumensis]|uniref:2OG-Fe dioxygenase family protein n=1 Tax=Amycolatopsis plumensis TaxID=236508 RepID=A0ABV5U3N9_9PSEU
MTELSTDVAPDPHQPPIYCEIDPGVELRRRGYAVVPGVRIRLSPKLRDSFRRFAATWDRLQPDSYVLTSQVRSAYRLRRYGHYLVPSSGTDIQVLGNRDYYQQKSANPLFGGIRRQFAGLTRDAQRNPFLLALLRHATTQITTAADAPEPSWLVDVHQIRILGTADQPGAPAPEGPHQDGLEFISVHLIARDNAAGGRTSLYRGAEQLVTAELTRPLDSVFVNDTQLSHYTEPITPAAGGTAVRDALLLGFRTAS